MTTAGARPVGDIFKVAVVISTHNRLDALAELLTELRSQDVADLNYEVIVVDSDAGTDSTGVVRAAHSEGLNARHLMSPNVLAAKRNVGAAACDADLLIFLDDDMRVGSSYVQAHVDAHNKLLGPAVVSGGVSFPAAWVRDSNYYRFKSGRHGGGQTEMEVGISPHHVVAMNLSVRRRDYMAIGGFDEGYAHYGCEDLDFGFRSANWGLALVLAPAAVAEHAEVRMSADAYFHKVYRAAYHGLPRLLSLHHDARQIPTVRLAVREVRSGVATQLAAGAIGIIARPGLVRALGTALDRGDRRPYLYVPLAYKVGTILANALGYRDYVAGRPPRGNTWSVHG